MTDMAKPTAFIRLSHAVAELRAAMGYLAIDHAHVMIGVMDDRDNRQRLVEALPVSLRPSVNRQRAEVVNLDGISIQVLSPRSRGDA